MDRDRYILKERDENIKFSNYLKSLRVCFHITNPFFEVLSVYVNPGDTVSSWIKGIFIRPIDKIWTSLKHFFYQFVWCTPPPIQYPSLVKLADFSDIYVL